MLSDLRPHEPFDNRYGFLEAMAAHNAVFADELGRRTHVAGFCVCVGPCVIGKATGIGKFACRICNGYIGHQNQAVYRSTSRSFELL